MSEKVEIVAELKDLISGKFADINKQIDAMDSKLDSVGSKNSGGGGIMGQVLGANLLTGAITKAGSAIYQFGKDSFDAYGRAEQFQVSLKTLLYGNEEQANALNNQLKQFALETPFELTEIQQGTKMMIAYGSSAGSVVEEMRMLGDIGSGVGSSLSEIAYLYGTLRTQGIAYTKDLNQFTGRGIPIVKELAKQFGVAESAIRKMTEEGKIGFKDIEKAFKSMTSEGGQFHDMMAAQSKTLLGQTSNLSDAWDQLKTAIGSSQQGILKDTISWATDMVASMKSAFEFNNFANETQAALPGFIQNVENDDERDTRYYAYRKALDVNGQREIKKFTNKEDRDHFLAKADAGRAARGEENLWEGGGAASSKYIAKEFQLHMFEQIKSANAQNAQERLNEATSLIREINEKTRIGEMSNTLAANELAMISKGVKTYKAILNADYSDKQKKKAEEEEANKPKKLEEVAKANKAVQVIVNIENLVRELTNVNQQASALNQLTTDGTLKALTVAVNNLYATAQ